ncbi:MAG: O-methyltransferase [Culicoidibacterales bacterium]
MQNTTILLETIEHFAKEHKIPIIMKDSVEWLSSFLAPQRIENVLEIGSAIGYSAINFHLLTNGSVLGVEKDKERFAEAIKNIAAFDKITIHLDDADSPEFYEKCREKAPFDLLFIDATKRNNKHFFEKFSPLVKQNGYIITDNLDFHGLVSTEEDIKKLHRRIRPLVRSIIEYSQWLPTLPNFQTTFIDVGDRLAITKKK